MFRNSMVFAFAVLIGMAAKAQTFAELQEAINVAAAGDTVYVENDLEFAEPLVVAKQLTLRSAGEATFKLTRAAAYTSGMFLTTTADTDLTLRQLELNGNPTAGNVSEHVFTINGGQVVFEAGFKLNDFKYANTTSTGAITIKGGGYLVMNEGAEIRGIEGASYATVVCVGSGNVNSGFFTMNGGLITDCHHHSTHASSAYGGIIYIYNGEFYAYGGTITGTTSDTCVAGVNAYTGHITLKGSFTATNNVGAVGNDVTQSTLNNIILFEGDYTGWMTFRPMEEPTEGGYTKKGWSTSAGATRKGLANVTSEQHPDLALNGESLYGNWYPTWTKLGARLGERKNVFTFAEVKNGIQDGDVVAFYRDFDLDSTMPLVVNAGQKITLTSATAEKRVLRRNCVNTSLLQLDNASSVRIENLIYDGNSENFGTNESWGFLNVKGGSELTLGNGSVIRNSKAKAYGAAVVVTGTSSKLIMEDGALITDCHATGNSYGSAVMIGAGGTAPAAPGPVFEMRGGTITGCSANGIQTPDLGYSGVVYVYQVATFDMSGGKITGNSATTGCSGVVNYLGTIRITGDAYIDGNDGPYPGIFNCGSRWTYYYGNFHGLVGVANDSQIEGENAKLKAEDASARGAWRFYPSRASTRLVGYQSGSDLKVYWKAPASLIFTIY